MPTLVLGTHNTKKRLELEALLAPLGLQLETLADHDAAIEVVEDGDTFADNARLKATVQAKHLGCWVLGEDSGLCVDALGGAPGVFSARYSGADATDQSNNAKLLAELEGVPHAKRRAHYVCHSVLSDPAGKVRAECHGECHGILRTEPDGTGGFGYDPLFEIAEYHQTFGRLNPAVKSVLSHRARALRQLVPQLQTLLESGAWTNEPTTASSDATS